MRSNQTNNESRAPRVTAGAASLQEVYPSPTLTLQSLQVQPIPVVMARQMVERHHYLHSFPGGTCLSFGVFCGQRLSGALTLGVGPKNACSLVLDATPDDCLALTRLWLSDDLPRNSESRVLGLTLRQLRQHTDLKFLVTYADPAQGHVGTIYQATNWLYTGLSQGSSRYDLGDGVPRHSRTVSQIYGTHSVAYLKNCGLPVRLVPQQPKHRYLFFLDSGWRERLAAPVLPYPKSETHL